MPAIALSPCSFGRNGAGSWRIITDWTAKTISDPNANAKSSSSALITLFTPAQYLLTKPEKSYLGRDNAVLEAKRGAGVPPLPLPERQEVTKDKKEKEKEKKTNTD